MKFTSDWKLWKILKKHYKNNGKWRSYGTCMICQTISNPHDKLNFKTMTSNEIFKDKGTTPFIRLDDLVNEAHTKIIEKFILKTSEVILKQWRHTNINALLKSKTAEKLKSSVTFCTFVRRKLLDHIIHHYLEEKMFLFESLCNEVRFLQLNNKHRHPRVRSRFLLNEHCQIGKRCNFILDRPKKKLKTVSFDERAMFTDILPNPIKLENLKSSYNYSQISGNSPSFLYTRAICIENKINDELSKLTNQRKLKKMFRKNMLVKSMSSLKYKFKENVIKYCTCLICNKSDKNEVHRFCKTLQQRETCKEEKTTKLSNRSKNSYPTKSSLILEDINNKERLLETLNSGQGDSKVTNSLTEHSSPCISRIIEDIPGIAKRDYFDWFQPKKTILTVNVLEMIPQKTNKSSSANTNNSVVESSSNLGQVGKTKTIQRTNNSLSNVDRTPTNSSTYNIDVANISNNNDVGYGYAEYLSKNNEVLSNYFNLNVNISTEDNSKINERSDEIKLFSDDNLFYENKKQLIHTKEEEREDKMESFVKKEEDGKKNGELNLNKSKTVMNLTNFYNDAKNQIDDSECDSPSEIYENSQYESVTVLKTEPIIYDRTMSNLSENELNTKQLNNLDDAIFVFQNNLEPIENGSSVFTSSNNIANNNVSVPLLDNTTRLLIGNITSATVMTTTTTTTSINTTNVNNINNVMMLTPEKSGANIKLTNIRNTSSLSTSFQNLSDIRLLRDSKNVQCTNDTVKNDNSNILCNANSFVSSNENKLPCNKINIKYFTLADENASEISSYSNLPSSSTILDSKCNLEKNKPSIKPNCNVKYLVKDKNIFKLFYVKAPPTDVVASNANISYQQHGKELIKDKKVNHIGSQSDPPKADSFLEASSINLPKLVQFEPAQNKNIKLTDASKMRRKNSESADNKQEDASSKPLNIVYRASKNPLIVGSKNIIVSFPPTNKQFPVSDVQNNLFSLSVDKDQKSYPPVSKKVLSTTASESSSSQTPPISSTAMEQVREFESILEKVTKISQLKDKVPHVEGIDTSLSNNQEATKNVSAVALGNILLQPAKIATYTNLIYTSDVKMTATEKSSGLKQPIPNKVTKQINTSFQPAPTISNSISTTANSAIKPLQKAQEDEKTTEKIYKILHSYSEKIKNAPELKNKPAPRRRSNPPLNTSAKCKKNVKCSGKLMYEANSSSSDYNCDFESNDKEITTSVFPIVTNQTKDNTSSNPLQIHHLAMPLSAAQDNQVVFVTNDKHLIFKKIKNVQKLWTKNNLTVKPIIKVEPGVKRTQVVHYNIKNSSVNSLSFINYVPTVNKPTNVITTTTTTPHLATFSPHSTINSVSNQNQVCKLAQETQTDVTMQNSNVSKNPCLDISLQIKSAKSCVNKTDLRRISVHSHMQLSNFPHLCVNLDKHYFKNIDVLFFTSLIVLKHPSSQLFMFEAINALNRIMETNPSLVSNNASKHFSVEQIHNLDSTFWKKFRIVYDIILKKKGPHITDTMIMVVEKVDKMMSDKILKLNNISEDKIKVNKNNKNPKCYGKKNGDHSGSNKTTKFPHPLEPTVIITNKLLVEDIDSGECDTYKKMSNCGKKRNFCKIGAINFDKIEVENPKICVPKKKKKCNKNVPSIKVSENVKNNTSETIKSSMKTRQNNRINLSKKNFFKKNKMTDKVKLATRKNVLDRIGSNNKVTTNDLLHVNGKKQEELYLEKKIDKSQNQNFKTNSSVKESGSKRLMKHLKTNDTVISNKRSIRSVVLNQANKKQKIN